LFIVTGRFVQIPAGPFSMGSNEHHRSERPVHCVVNDAFDIATAQVRRSEYARFLARTDHPEPRGWLDPAFADPNQPVVGVNWFDAMAYCAWLSSVTGEEYRLPTEAEWEKAAKGGRDSEYAWGDAPPESFPCYQEPWTGPRPAGEQAPNPYGLFNMGDNVHEWCLDWFSPTYYAESPVDNPPGPSAGKRRVSRGGSWRHAVKASRTAHRSSLPPEYRYADYGFRLVRCHHRRQTLNPPAAPAAGSAHRSSGRDPAGRGMHP
jgi:iron(II)-dependent oxidoreductase